MPAPTFLCIGAQKCGTTWLASAVAQHPQVAAGRKKELHFFDNREAYARGLGWYEEQFRVRPHTVAIGEFTPNYWLTVGPDVASIFPGAAERVAAAYPGLQLILCLRDPVERAISAYFHQIKAGRVAPSVSLLEAARERPGIIDFGRYATQLGAWLAHYPLERFLVLVYEEDIRPDEAKPQTLRRTFEHLGVDPDFEPEGIGAQRNVRLSHFEMRLRHASPARRRVMELLPQRARESDRWTITVPDDDRRTLADVYAPETARLEEMLDRTMPWPRPTG